MGDSFLNNHPKSFAVVNASIGVRELGILTLAEERHLRLSEGKHQR